MPAQALAAVATLLAFARHGNRVDLQLDRGTAELVWSSPSTFRFRRSLDGPLPPVAPPGAAAVDLQIDDTPGAARIRSKFLEVTIQKHGALVRVRKLDSDAVLMADLSEPHEDGGSVVWERQAPPGVRYFGLGPRADPDLNLRGKSIEAGIPFLISSAGYGEYHAAGGRYRFDFTPPDRYRIQAPRVDYFFYYGPPPKEIFQEHHASPAAPVVASAAPANPSWAALKSSLLLLVSGAMSGDLEPSFDLATYDGAAPELLQRARQLGSLVSKVTPGSAGLSPFRKQLNSFFDIYAIEVRDHGHPTWHPLPFQFPDDPEGARHADEFMLGDEMLIAPICEPGLKRQLYLPQGVWTNLETNEVFQGRRTVAVETLALPVFARNGSIVPLDSPGGIGLHYFPTLGGEFFLLEDDIGEYTQVHAAPALDAMRLEIESKKDRDYQWVVHHVDRPAQVGFEERKYTPVATLAELKDGDWFYDAARRDLHVRARVKAGEDCILNLEW
jgi:hypothetical protein